MNIPGFSKEALLSVNQLLYAEHQHNPYEGQCKQKELREKNKRPRTPAQEQADRQRAQSATGKDVVPSGIRSEAAKRAAETRKRCKGSTAPKPPQAPQSPGVK
jgi:hypothetical protein